MVNYYNLHYNINNITILLNVLRLKDIGVISCVFKCQLYQKPGILFSKEYRLFDILFVQ